MDDRAVAILITLVAYKVVLLAIGLLVRARNRDEDDFFLAGRRMGPLVAAISASASSSSVWTLLGVSGYAYARGLSAVWLFPACVGGFALNWFLVAPRLRRMSAASGALTLTDVVAGAPGRPGRRAVQVVAAVVVLGAFTLYVAAQLQGAGDTFETNLGFDPVTSVLVGSAVVIAYTMLGGFWAVSLTDTLQGLMMAGTAAVLPVLALVAVGGPAGMWAGMQGVEGAAYADLTHGLGEAAALGLVLGLLGIGLGYPGQPHVVNRFMALRDERAMRAGRRYALAWAALVYTGMIVVGWCARSVLETPPGEQDQAMLAAIDVLCAPVFAGIMLAAILSAVMSTADSQLLVASSAVTHDLRGGREDPRAAVRTGRLVVLGLSVAAVCLALWIERGIFERVLSAWDVLGAAFGPLLLVILWRGPVGRRATLAAMLAGGGLAAMAHVLPLDPGLKGVLQRVAPYAVAFAIAWAGVERRAG